MSMITVEKLKIIEDEAVAQAVLDVITEREAYYTDLFASGSVPAPRITIRFENLRPFRLRITFAPRGEKPVMIDIEGYGSPEVVTKHAFKKLRRTAKNYFAKNKPRHRQ